MDERTNDETEIPEPVESDTRRATGMGDPGTLPSEEDGAERHESRAGAEPAPGGRGGGTETRRATGMGEPGTLPSDRGPAARARQMAGGRLEEAAVRVRELGDRAATRNRLLGPTRPLAHNAADGIDSAAHYVRTREVDEMRDDLETTVRRHPLASITVAFLAGYSLRRIF